MRRLEIGPGSERIPGFETLNLIATPQTDHVGDARKPPFADATFDLVYSSHCIEHVHWYEVEPTLAEWVRILKPGGTLEVFTVNGLMLMKALVVLEETGEWTGPGVGTWQHERNGGDPYKWAVGRLLNYPRGGADIHLHRSIITPSYLRRCFEQAGLVGLEEMTDAEVRGNKRHRAINMGLRGRKC